MAITTAWYPIEIGTGGKGRAIYKVVSGETTKYFEIIVDINGAISTNDVTAEVEG